MIYFVFLNMVASLLRQIICSLVTTLIEESNLLKQSVFFWPTKSNIQKTFLSFVEITNVLQSIVFTVSMTNVSIGNFCFVLIPPTAKLVGSLTQLSIYPSINTHYSLFSNVLILFFIHIFL